MLTTAQRIMMGLAQQYDLLTVSGNEITDYVRTLPDQGDGLSNDGSTGVWPAATNRAINSNAKTNTTSIIDVGATTTRETTGLVGADTTRFSTVTDNVATAEGTSQLIDGGAGSTQYTFSVWLSGTGTVKLYISDSVAGKQLGSQITLTSTPTKYSVTATTGALGITETCGWETDSQQSITVTHGRWMCETGAIAKPHVLTDGAQATRSAGRIQQPIASLFTPTQGWFVWRLRMGWTKATPPFSNGAGLLEWGDDTDNHFLAYFNSLGAFKFNRRGSATNQEVAVTTPAFSVGDLLTIVIAWTGTAVKGSINGVAFSTQSGSTIPVLADKLADISGSPTFNVTIPQSTTVTLHCVAGSGLLTDADAAYYHSLGNAGPPRFAGLPGHPTALWDGVSGVFQRRR